MSPSEIEAFRRECGLSAEAFGRALGVDGETVRRWEKGETKPGGPAVLAMRQTKELRALVLPFTKEGRIRK